MENNFVRHIMRQKHATALVMVRILLFVGIKTVVMLQCFCLKIAVCMRQAANNKDQRNSPHL